jgi:transposase-like protein
MGKPTRKKLELVREQRISLGMLIHDRIRVAIEQAVEEELTAALGVAPWQRSDERAGYRNGTRERTLTGPSGPVELTLPRATVFTDGGNRREWSSQLVPRYQRRMDEVNEAVMAVYLSGANTRRIRGALRPLLKDAPLGRSAISRVVQTLKSELEKWQKRPLDGLDVVYVYLDAFCLRVRSANKVVSQPVLAAVAVLTDGNKQLVSLEMCGSESRAAWKGFLDDLVERGLRTPKLCVVDGCPGLRGALERVWPEVDVQRCAVHKLRNLERKAPKHALDEIKEDYHLIVYAKSEREARSAFDAFVRKWKARCPGVVRSLQEGGDELLTFYRYPESQWKTLRTTNVIERLNEEFRRRTKTQGSLPTEDAALILLFGLLASGQIKLRRIDGWKEIPRVLSAPPTPPSQRAAA